MSTFSFLLPSALIYLTDAELYLGDPHWPCCLAQLPGLALDLPHHHAVPYGFGSWGSLAAFAGSALLTSLGHWVVAGKVPALLAKGLLQLLAHFSLNSGKN